jgi:hypothetical protein
MVKRSLSRSVAVASVIALLGCGRQPQAQLSGTVAYEGRTLTSGTVMAFGADGKPRYGQIANDGHYTIEAIPPGPVLLAVTSPDPNAEIEQRPRGTIITEPAHEPVPLPNRAGQWFPIPSRYAATSTSHLQCDAHDGANKFDVQLTK